MSINRDRYDNGAVHDRRVAQTESTVYKLARNGPKGDYRISGLSPCKVEPEARSC